ncbi:glycosyltransferase [Elizabethkingia meningoseptica]
MDKRELAFDIVAIKTDYRHGLQYTFEELGARVFYMPDNLYHRIIFLYSLMKKGSYDIVHSHPELPSAIYLTLAKLTGVKVRIAHAHLSVFNDGIKNNLLRKVLNSVVTHRLGASKYSIKALFGEKYVNSAIVLNNAIEVSNFSFKEEIREEYRKKLSLHEKYVLGFVGRLTHLKNIFYLLEILKELVNVNNKVVLLIIGDGELREEFEDKAGKLKLNNNLLMLGNRNDINCLLMAMDVLLLPSYSEGLGIVLIEAQAAALKAVASQGRVPEEAKISDYLLFESIEKDPKVWRDIILEKCQNYERIPMEKQIKEKHFDIKEEAKILIDLYKNWTKK